MIGIVVLTGASWLLFKFVLKKNLFLNWFTPLNQRGIEALTGFGIALTALLVPLGIKTLIFSTEWQINSTFAADSLIGAFYFFFKSILFEELVFRGALLSILAYYAKNKTAVIISAICFGVYHWFSYGMLGSGIIPMAYIFLVTGGMGFVWAYIYIKTNSVVMPSLIHLSWNYVSSLVLDYQPFGQLLFKSNNNIEYSPLVEFGFKLGGELLSIFLIYILFQLYLRNKKGLIQRNQPLDIFKYLKNSITSNALRQLPQH